MSTRAAVALAAIVFMIAVGGGIVAGRDSSRSAGAVHREAPDAKGHSSGNAQPSGTSFAEDLEDLGVPGIVGALAGALVGWFLTTKSERRARDEEREYQEARHKLEAVRGFASTLDEALADAGGEGSSLISAGDAAAGLRRAFELFSPIYGRYALRLPDDRDVTDSVRTVIEFFARSQGLSPVSGELDYGLKLGFRRVVANARACLDAVRMGEAPPHEGILRPGELAELLREGPETEISPFARLQQWVDENRPDPAVQRFLDTQNDDEPPTGDE